MKHEIICITPNKIAEDNRNITAQFGVLECEYGFSFRYLEYHAVKQAYRVMMGRERSPWTRVPGNMATIMNLLRDRGRTLILGFEPHSLMTLLINRLKQRHRCIHWSSWPWFLEDFSGRSLVPFRKQLCRAFLDGVVSVATIKQSVEALSQFGSAAQYIPYSVDTELFRPASPRHSAGRVRVLFAGALIETKGIGLLLDVIRNSTWDNTEFWFAGRGPFEGEIKSMEAAGLPVRYMGFVGTRKDMVHLYQDADIFVLPSIKKGRTEERFGIVLIEAMACNSAVIATDCIGPRQVIENGKTGILIPQNNAQALRETLKDLVRSPEKRAELGRNGRLEAEQVYDTRVVARQWLEVIKNVLNGGGQCSQKEH